MSRSEYAGLVSSTRELTNLCDRDEQLSPRTGRGAVAVPKPLTVPPLTTRGYGKGATRHSVAGMGHSSGLHLWVDATAGIAGDMMLGALIDAGAPLDGVESAVSAVVPGEVALRTSTVQRAGLRALKVDVESRAEDHPHRSWARIRSMLETAELTTAVRTTALAAFARLADAEARVHGVSTDDVHFHEVGSWDSIADIVGVCAALAELAVTRVTASPVAVGSGRTGSVHGDLPVPPPAVLELARGWRVLAGGEGELATPTGMALIRALADECSSIAPMEITAVGVGAGGRDVPGRANVVRVALGIPVADVHGHREHVGTGDERRRPGSAGVADGTCRVAGGGRRRRVAGADRDEEGSAGTHAVCARP